MFGEGEAAEEQDCVDGVAGESVPKIWNAGDVAGEEAGRRARIAAEELPNGEIGDQEELDSAEERREADASDGAAAAEPEADGDVDEEAGVDDGDQLVEADEDVACEQCEEGEEEGQAAVLEERTGEESHGADGSKVPGMRCDAQGGGENDQSKSEQRATEEVFFLRNFGIHFFASSS